MPTYEERLQGLIKSCADSLQFSAPENITLHLVNLALESQDLLREALAEERNTELGSLNLHLTDALVEELKKRGWRWAHPVLPPVFIPPGPHVDEAPAEILSEIDREPV